MGYRKKVDGNQPRVVRAIRDARISVAHTHSVGKGFPDIVIGVPGGLTIVGNYDIKKVMAALSKIAGVKVIEGASLLLEIKDDAQPPSKRQLTPDEKNWHLTWQGQVAIVNNEEEALRLISGDDKHYEKLCAMAGIENSS